MPNANVVHLVFKLKYGESVGTCFTIELNEKQYLITAKHMVDGIRSKESVFIYQQNSPVPHGID